MRSWLLLFAVSGLLIALGGCLWASGGGAPLTPERRASLVEKLESSPRPPEQPFTSDGPIPFLLETDFAFLDRDRSRESEEIPGVVIVSGYNGSPVEIPVEVKTRGNFRLRPDICELPPLRLDFPSREVFGTLLDGQDKVKVVTHCRDGREYEENLLEEYLAYRLYNLLTDASFRVQLAEITYLDTSGVRGTRTRRAFLIEEDEALARRLGGELLEIPGLAADLLNPEELGVMYLFQYMIGNTDWSADGGHNMKYVRHGDTIVAVPYDFDFSGLVDAPYAGPAPSVADRIRSVRERIYQGQCVAGIDYLAVMDRFRGLQGDMFAAVDGLRELPYPRRLETRSYLQEFFLDLGYPDRVQERIIGACRR